jgi:hypothetical protein
VIRNFFLEQRFPREAFICKWKCLCCECLSWRILTSIECYEAGCTLQYSPVIAFSYCTGILYIQLQCVCVSLLTIWAVCHIPWWVRCLVPFGHLLHPWDLSLGFHDGYLKVLKLCVLVQWHYFNLQLLFVTSFRLHTLHCVVECLDWDFQFFSSVQTNATTVPQIRPWHSPSMSFPVYY